MMMKSLDPHFFAACYASATACEILELLPKNDLVEELQDLLTTQFDLLCCLIEGKHYGSDEIDHFLSYVEEIKHQIIRLKGSSHG